MNPIVPQDAPVPAPYSATEALSSWLSRFTDCRLAMVCGCGRMAEHEVGALIKRAGDVVVGEAVGRLRCRACGNRPASIYLQGFPEGAKRKGWSIRLDGIQSLREAGLFTHDSCISRDERYTHEKRGAGR